MAGTKKQKKAFGEDSEFTVFERLFGSKGDKSNSDARRKALLRKRKRLAKMGDS